MTLRARNASPWRLATLNPRSTCYGPRPGPTLAPRCSGGLPACPGAEGTRKDPRPGEKEILMCKNKHIYTYLVVIYIPRFRQQYRGDTYCGETGAKHRKPGSKCRGIGCPINLCESRFAKTEDQSRCSVPNSHLFVLYFILFASSCRWVRVKHEKLNSSHFHTLLV